jgi:hypothetical protein
MRRSLTAAVAASLLILGVAGPAAAAAPANDTFAGATPIAFGETISEDTTEANTDADEVALNDFCGAPVVQHGVWFTFAPSADGFIAFDTRDSNFSAGIMLFAGPNAPTGDDLLNCGPGRIANDVFAGVSYSLLVFGDGLTPETGGNLVFKVETAVPPPDIEVSIDKFGNVDKTGVVRITGTVTCSSETVDPVFFETFGDVTQRVGRVLIRGFFDTISEIPCDGSTTAWEALVFPDNGLFAGGKAATIAFSFGCTDICSQTFTEATIQLKKGKVH